MIFSFQKQPKYSAIFLAGGEGKRFGRKKQFEQINGFPIWQYVRDKLCQLFDDYVVVGIDTPRGETRRKSVENGLKKIKGNKVIIIETARPLIDEEQINLMKTALENYKNVSFYKNLINTIYDGVGFARSGIFEVLTPQGFDVKLLKKCLKKDKTENPTDECQTIEKIGKVKTFWIEGDFRNHKITYREDLELINSYNLYNKIYKNKE